MVAKSDTPSKLRLYDELNLKVIFECCEQGDELAQQVMRRTGEIMGMGVANYASVVNPEAIIFTGIVPRVGHWLLDPARELFEENVFHNLRGRVKFLTSTLTDMEQNVLGASVLAWQVKEYSLFK
jgi:glucokinase